jgi:pilus assembly protein Flp/PilA
MTGLVKYVGEDAGASAAEYALILAFIALVIIVSITAFGASLNTMFSGEAATFSSL